MSITDRIQSIVAGGWAHIAHHRLCEPTVGPIVLAILTLLVLIPASRMFILHNLPYTVTSSNDIRAHMSIRLLENPEDGRRAVFNLGGSSLLRAVDEDAGLERRLGGAYEVFNLSTPSQSLVESWVLLQRIGLRSGDLVVMHVNISRLNNLLPEPHWICRPYFYSVNPDDILDVLEEMNLSAEVSSLCRVTWLSRRVLIRNILQNMLSTKGTPEYRGIYPLPHDRDAGKLEGMRADRRAKQADPAFAESWLRLNREAALANGALILRMHRFVAERHASFVLLDLPMNHDWIRRYHGQWFPFEQQYREVIAPLVQAGVDYRDLRNLSGFGFDDYYDHTHFIEGGREKFFPYYRAIVTEKLSRGIQH